MHLNKKNIYTQFQSKNRTLLKFYWFVLTIMKRLCVKKREKKRTISRKFKKIGRDSLESFNKELSRYTC